MLRKNSQQYLIVSVVAIQFNLFVLLFFTSPVQSVVQASSGTIKQLTTLTGAQSQVFFFGSFFTLLYIQYLLGTYLSFTRCGPSRTHLSNVVFLALSACPIFAFLSIITFTLTVGATVFPLYAISMGFVLTTGTTLLYLYAVFARFDIPFGWDDPAAQQRATPTFLRRLFE